MSVGYVVRDDQMGVIDVGHRDIWGRGSNNVAEYTAVITACCVAKKHPHNNLTILTDSQLVLKQLRGDYAVKNARLKSLHKLAIDKLKELRATVRWHSREDGDGPLADALASYKYKEILNARNDREVQPSGIGSDDNRHASETAGPQALLGFKADTVEVSA